MNRMFLTAAALVALGLGPVAKADITWTFNGGGGNLMTTSQPYTVNGITITATSHKDNGDSDSNLFEKCCDADETGLGLKGDPSGDDEIYLKRYIQLDLSNVNANDPLSLTLQSVTDGEQYQVYTSTAALGIGDVTGALGSGVTLFADDQSSESVTGLNRGSTSKFFVAIEVNDDNTNVLLASLTATQSNRTTTPEPRFYGFLLVSLLAIPAIRRRFVPQQ